jgi:hypothetical protein
MPISLPTLRSLAAEVAVEEQAGVAVLGTTNTEGSADFAKVLYGHLDRGAPPAPLVITVKRRLAEEEVRNVLRHRLRAYLRGSA